MKESKIEIRGLEANHYDLLMNLATLGKYPKFIKSAIAQVDIKPNDHIIDLGCGTGRNACLMAEYLSESGSLIGIDIGDEMLSQFRRKCAAFPNVSAQQSSIVEPLPFKRQFDKVFMSFVLLGFPDENKERILANVVKALKDGGQFALLDWNEFQIEDKPFWFRWAFKNIECRLASDFIKVDWKSRLRELGFSHFEETVFFKNTIRLLKAW